MGNASTENLFIKSEKVIFSFETKFRKILSTCKSKKSTYLAYRYGSLGKLELQFPKTLDSTSWRKFKSLGIHRGGRKINAGFGDYSMEFKNENIGYTVFQEWRDDDDTYSIGVAISASGKNKPTTINGLKNRKKGL